MIASAYRNPNGVKFQQGRDRGASQAKKQTYVIAGTSPAMTV
jgi:hypothetical protein